ncbi:histidine phosphotransferase family protein [Solirhodobacter olei]|uniref:histidine phosphotransferase family protein n=1 Tax=Solirhodobacter olei TaxID=2493082 RepID=UPI000FDB0413|nr:histidine phosphotransferase family protein [Solirhodobacter olei]
MPDKLDLPALVGSRICHDLISPLGAIGNGVELMGLGGGGTGEPELGLIAESVAAANARIRFYRVAFGFAGDEQRVGRPEILSILADLTEGARLSVDWQVPGDQARAEVKLAFLVLQCLETALPFGGEITVAREGEPWKFVGKARRLKIDAALWAAFRGEAGLPDLTPAQVQFALAPEAAAARGRRLSCEIGETEIRAAF